MADLIFIALAILAIPRKGAKAVQNTAATLFEEAVRTSVATQQQTKNKLAEIVMSL